MRRSRHAQILAAIAAGAVICVGALIIASAHAHNAIAADRFGAVAAASHAGRSSDITSGRASRALVSAPSCAPITGPVSSTVSITMSTANDSFSQSCYYAPANKPFTIDFTNPIFALGDNSPVTLNLIISPSNSPAFVPDPGYPGSADGSTANASFVSPPVTAPNTGAFSVPALPAGTYDVQTLIDEPNVTAILVVQ